MATITKTQSKQVQVISDVICNRCEKSCKDDCDGNFEGLIDCNIRGGYASKLVDQTLYNFSLCEDCLKWLFDQFKIDPLIPDLSDYIENELGD